MENVLLILSFISGMCLLASFLYIKFRKFKDAKSSSTAIYIPYLNIWIKPIMIYFVIGLAFAFIMLFGDDVGIKDLLRESRYR